MYTINPDGSITLSNETVSRGVPVGLFANMPAAKPGDLFIASDQPEGRQVYYSSVAGEWYPIINLGGSGILTLDNGSLDVNLAVLRLLVGATVSTRVWFAAYQSTAQNVLGSTDTPVVFDAVDANSTAGISHAGEKFTVTDDGIYTGFAQVATNSLFGAIAINIYLNYNLVARSTVSDSVRAWNGLSAQVSFSTFARSGDIFMVEIAAGTGLITTPGDTRFTIWR